MRMKTMDYTATRREWVLPDGIHRYIMLRSGSEWIISVYNPQTDVHTSTHRINSRELATLAKSKETAMRNYRSVVKEEKKKLPSPHYKPSWEEQ